MDNIEQSIGLISSLHTRFAGHPLLAECRLWGGDLGMHFHHSNVVDAVWALEALRYPAVDLEGEQRAARDLLLTILRQMIEDEDRRRGLLVDHGGPETLLHGDLWHQNVMLVTSEDGQLRPHVIDWDHAAVGHVCYDLSTFLNRVAKAERPALLERYRAEVASVGWRHGCRSSSRGFARLGIERFGWIICGGRSALSQAQPRVPDEAGRHCCR